MGRMRLAAAVALAITLHGGMAVSADEPEYLVALGAQMCDESPADEARCPGDRVAHVDYSPSSASNSADSRRALITERNRAASAPSTMRWS